MDRKVSQMPMPAFVGGDGRVLPVVAGFRDWALSYRPATSPRPGWTDEQLAASADKKQKRGCHKRGIVDIPFAHARLSLDDYRRFLADTEGEELAATRGKRLETLNRFTVREWRRAIESRPWEVPEWREDHSEVGAAALREHPQVLDSLLPDIEEKDLLTERIKVWLRRR
jgi:hypothetical protein